MEKSPKYLLRRSLGNEAVQVVVRCRPMNEKEMSNGYKRVIEVWPARGVVEITNPKDDTKESAKVFTFDAVYDWNSRQEDLYEESIRPLVSSVLDGFNGTIFAYGQTGTGKTYTMEGSKSDSSQKGVIPKSFEQIFNYISRSSNMQYLVHASYLEIYQEEIRDLLNPDHAQHLELREKPDVGVYVKDISSFVCKSVHDIEQVMFLGNMNRSIGATNMNEHSSRSHAIFMVTIEMGATGAALKKVIRVGKLNLVDLAGSERQSKTGATGERLKEASKINLSLSALGNVISALVDGKTSHIPYRDSKLTRILQDSLGGNSKTVMIANIGPASYNYDESLTTLRYANRAKNIKNKPRVNEDPKDALLREYQQEISRLKKLLAEKQLNRVLDMQSEKGKKGGKQMYGDDSELSNDECSDEQDNKKKKLLNISAHALPEDKQKITEELKQRKEQIAKEKREAEELQAQITFMESSLLCGGKNIVDHTNEQQRALEQRRQEIAEQKKREVEMRQQLELQEESAVEIRETYTNLQQEVEVKTRKLKKLFSKLQATKQEIYDVTEEFNRDRRELELTQNELLKELKKKCVIIENFIPCDEKNKLIVRIYYDEENDAWCMMPLKAEESLFCKRPVNNEGSRRPVSDYGRVAIKVGRDHRYHGENVINVELDSHTRTTGDYHGPAVAPKIQAVLDEALKDEGDIDVDAASLCNSHVFKSKLYRKNYSKDKFLKINNIRNGTYTTPARNGLYVQSQLPVFPKTRGLVPK
ncbi:kinesin-like protein KIF3B isoform X2 [Bacillus rossius redtenbacheri]|uniref:kinesin-like protein KIF3B isoform X2 n=1 Tax=Bacillus rossius redtenbacheri TaxID=93214 RepID=UPI002FDC979C